MTNTLNDSTVEYRIGVISDTHGLLRPEAIAAFQGVSLIIHAGDIGTPEVLRQLHAVAPVVAVRGNNDHDYWTRELPLTEVVEVGKVTLYVLHSVSELDLDPAASGFSAVISGHSHRPLKEKRHGVFFLNPGSAGPRRLKLPVSVAIISIMDQSIDAEIIGLGV
jgi:putative phosphoesterase